MHLMRAFLLPDMRFILFAEILDGGNDRIGGRLAQAAQRTVLNRLGNREQGINVLVMPPALGNPGENLQHLPRPQPAGRALAAGFRLGKA